MKRHTRSHNRSQRKYASMVILSLLFLLSSRCEIADNGAEGEVIPIIVFSSQDEFNTYYENMPKDSVTIKGNKIDGDELEINVLYRGGCKEHSFTLVESGKVYYSNPPQLAVFLVHNSFNDPCSDIIDDVVYFDLGPLREKYSQGGVGKAEALVIRLNDEPIDNWLTDRSMWLFW